MAVLMDRLPGDTTVSFGDLLARSVRFKALFKEGMDLVEEAATYLDGTGRADARLLRPDLAATYSAESMRLTTRLMQIASWLLIRRSIVDGETPRNPDGPVRFKFTAHGIVAAPMQLAELPATLRSLVDRSLRLQTRILHLDGMVNDDRTATLARPVANGPSEQFALLRAVYGQRG